VRRSSTGKQWHVRAHAAGTTTCHTTHQLSICCTLCGQGVKASGLMEMLRMAASCWRGRQHTRHVVVSGTLGRKLVMPVCVGAYKRGV
jgi:hypothetical protein